MRKNVANVARLISTNPIPANNQDDAAVTVTSFPDINFNGIDDDFETLFGTVTLPNDDPDIENLTSIQEFYEYSDPFSPNAGQKVIVFPISEITIPTILGRIYEVEISTTELDLGDWSSVGRVGGTGSNNTLQIPNVTGADVVFGRVKTNVLTK